MNPFGCEIDARAKEVCISKDELTVALVDGRTISAPLAWFPRLLDATSAERRHFELLGDALVP